MIERHTTEPIRKKRKIMSAEAEPLAARGRETLEKETWRVKAASLPPPGKEERDVAVQVWESLSKSSERRRSRKKKHGTVKKRGPDDAGQADFTLSISDAIECQTRECREPD